MRKLLILFLCSFALVSGSFAQKLSDQQVIQMAVKEKQAGASETEIATRLMQKGATMDQIQRIRSQYAQQITKRGMDDTVDNAIGNAQARMRTNNEPNDNAITASGGAEAPRQMNIATPQNYVLGPGDQLIIDVYGDTQKSEQLTVSPDGDVTVPEYGPIHVAGLSVASAQKRVRSRLGSYYQSSDIKVTVGQTRSIMVNVMGEVRTPGTYTLSAFATVFHALYMAGGISDLGTLRSIKVFRQGRQISVVDVGGQCTPAGQ